MNDYVERFEICLCVCKAPFYRICTQNILSGKTREIR